MRATTRLGFVAIVAASLSAAPSAMAQERNNAREAVANLEAYAVYKMGRYDEARGIWEDLAAKGNTTAMINLANLFEQGQGVTEDRRRALDLVHQAARLGDARAQYEIGIAYEKGGVLGRDITKAGEWLAKSAAQDYADGQFAYGVWLAAGGGKGIDQATAEQRREALAWLEKAKANGNVEAGDYIGVLKQNGS